LNGFDIITLFSKLLNFLKFIGPNAKNWKIQNICCQMFWKPNETIGNCCFVQQEIVTHKLLKPKLNNNTFFFFLFLLINDNTYSLSLLGRFIFELIPYLKKTDNKNQHDIGT
jgi:hypothetical protein